GGTLLRWGRLAGTRPVMQSGAYAALIGKVSLEIDPATHRAVSSRLENLEPRPGAGSTLARVKKVAALLDWALAEAEEIGQEVIGTTTAAISRAVDLTPDGQVVDDDRGLESPLTNLVANMFRDRLAEPGRGGARIGVQNPGGTRADLLAGALTYSEAADVLPFANTLMTARLTGAQFKTLLEQQWQPPGASRPYLQLGLSDNVAYTYDASRAEGDRITSITIDGAPLDREAEYVVGSSAYLIGGGDNFTVFTAAGERRDSGLSDLEEWVEYIKGSAALAPSFAKQAVQVSPTPMTLMIGRPQPIRISCLDFAKVSDAVPNTRLTARIDDTLVGSAKIADGAADLNLSLPPALGKGFKTLAITASPTGTTLIIPVEVLATGG
ncbi:MAG: 5'-nucleotidase, partial [Chromatiaceae bacterium]